VRDIGPVVGVALCEHTGNNGDPESTLTLDDMWDDVALYWLTNTAHVFRRGRVFLAEVYLLHCHWFSLIANLGVENAGFDHAMSFHLHKQPIDACPRKPVRE
jgi:hypothetical protein